MPNANNQGTLETLWVGGEGGMEEALVRRVNVPFESIPAAGLHGVGLRSLPGNLVTLSRGLIASRRILRRFNPDALLFTGGYVAAPMALAARLSARRKRPFSLVYIPDIEPGLALKALLRLCDHAALTNEASQAFIPAGLPGTISGYPLRDDLLSWAGSDRLKARQALAGLVKSPTLASDELPILLVVGGSKGARSINQAIQAALSLLLPKMHLVHLTGNLDWETIQQTLANIPDSLRSHYHPLPYLHEMGPALAAADLVLSRAGASSLGEYPLFGLPAILVPYPYAWRYQRVNAEYLSAHNAAIMIRDEDLSEQLAFQVTSLLADSARRTAMGQAMAALARPEAAQTIAKLLIQTSSPRDGSSDRKSGNSDSLLADQETA